jgi:hypothetical protein
MGALINDGLVELFGGHIGNDHPNIAKNREQGIPPCRILRQLVQKMAKSLDRPEDSPFRPPIPQHPEHQGRKRGEAPAEQCVVTDVANVVDPKAQLR